VIITQNQWIGDGLLKLCATINYKGENVQ